MVSSVQAQDGGASGGGGEVAADLDEAARVARERFRRALSNLSRDEQEEYQKLAADATRYFRQKRVIEAIDNVHKCRKILKDDPNMLNLLGACYVELRNFDKAREVFTEAAKLAPKDRGILFNLAEMDFVTGKWEDAERSFTELVPLYAAVKTQSDIQSLLPLVQFKLLITKIKLGKMDQAEEMAELYDFRSDTPYHYFAEAALAYGEGEEQEAAKWIRSAVRIFKKDEVLSPWRDSLVEAGYVRSHYGPSDFSTED